MDAIVGLVLASPPRQTLAKGRDKRTAEPGAKAHRPLLLALEDKASLWLT